MPKGTFLDKSARLNMVGCDSKLSTFRVDFGALIGGGVSRDSDFRQFGKIGASDLQAEFRVYLGREALR